MKLDRPRIQVDFNEMIEDVDAVVLLAKADSRLDSDGNTVELSVGLKVYLYMPDLDENGSERPLLATGFAEVNDRNDWSSHVKWCCRILSWE